MSGPHALALTLALGLVAAGGPAVAGDGTRPASPGAGSWTPEQGVRVLARLGDREPFLLSSEARRHPDSLNHFFNVAEYRRLLGNPVYGYWADDGFRWLGERVAWGGIVAAGPSARPIGRRAWDSAFAYIARAHGLIVDPQAPIQVRGACIAAVTDPSLREPNRGVVLELTITSPTGRFWYRFGMGKPTLEDAIGASLDWAVGFARTINGSAAAHATGGTP